MRRCTPIIVANLWPIITMLVLLTALLGIPPAQLEAQTGAGRVSTSESQPRQSIEGFLRLDGTLKLSSGYMGSLDARGYKMVSGPDEAPRFEQEAAAEDERWAGGFGLPGTNYEVYALAADGSGNLYVGGSFSAIGGMAANHIARWNGSQWSPLGSGTDGVVRALVLDEQGNLYAGGSFRKAGGVPAKGIARWNGSQWSALGSGVNDTVYALAVDDRGNLYAGGYFTSAGGVEANCIAKWNGGRWSALGEGLSGRNDPQLPPIVTALAVDRNGNLYAGGSFTTADRIHAANIAKWNGIKWSALGTGMNSIVLSLTFDRNENLYAGGWFTSAGEVAARYIAKWNGIYWSDLESGMNAGVISLSVDESGNLYAGGCFTTAGGLVANHVAKWNGSGWSALGSGIDPGPDPENSSIVVYCLVSGRDGSLLVGGQFPLSGGVQVNSIAKWDGNAWFALGAGIDRSVKALAVDGNGNVYAGGEFHLAGGVAVNYIAKWNGSSWTALDSGLNGPVNALVIDMRGNLYAGGEFTTAGGIEAMYIAKWNGNSWSSLGTGMNSPVEALAADERGNLYAGGRFQRAGGIEVKHVAKWNGSEWSALGSGMDSDVLALALDERGNLYAGGKFCKAGNRDVIGLARWNGSEWASVGRFGGRVYALAIDRSGILYVGGEFWRTGVWKRTNYIARWDGSEWALLGTGTDDSVNALAIDENGNVYAAGQFTAAGEKEAYLLAMWDGHDWFRLGSGVGALATDVFALAIDGNGNLYAGGAFCGAGGKGSSKIAKWMGRPALAVGFTERGLNIWNEDWHRINSKLPNILAAWGDRLIMCFPSMGIYLHDGSSTKKISGLKSSQSVIGIADSLYVDAGTQGINRYKGGWNRIHGSDPAIMASRGEKLVASFTGTGVWEYDGAAWKRISPWTNAEQMVGIGQRLYVDFGSKGVYTYDGTWLRTTRNNPSLLHAYGKTLVGSFDSGSRRGIYAYRDNFWSKISSDSSVEGFASTPYTLYADCGGAGIYMYDRRKWARITTQDPESISIYAGKLVADFPSKGVYLYVNPKWRRLSADKDAGLMQGVHFK